MAKIVQNNFSSGEITPLLSGRSDLAAYYKACANSENFIVTKEGTLRKRHGISTIAEFNFSSETYEYDHVWTCISPGSTQFTCASTDGTITTFSSNNGIYVSHVSFASVNWKSIARYINNVMAIGIETVDDVTYAVCAYSADNGSTWTKRTIGQCFDAGAATFTGTTGVFLCETLSAETGGSLSLIKTTDYGVTWTTVIHPSESTSIASTVSTYTYNRDYQSKCELFFHDDTSPVFATANATAQGSIRYGHKLYGACSFYTYPAELLSACKDCLYCCSFSYGGGTGFTILGMQLTQPSTTSCLPPLMMVVLGLGAVTIICSANR